MRLLRNCLNVWGLAWQDFWAMVFTIPENFTRLAPLAKSVSQKWACYCGDASNSDAATPFELARFFSRARSGHRVSTLLSRDAQALCASATLTGNTPSQSKQQCQRKHTQGPAKAI